MSTKEIEAFAAACAKATRKEPAETLRVGQTLWMLGAPAPAERGMVGLATSATQTVFLRKEDLVEVRESEGRYLVCIAADANLIVREELLGKLHVLLVLRVLHVALHLHGSSVFHRRFHDGAGERFAFDFFFHIQ